jgi:non-ribosomal peptide synthetase component F
VQEARDGLKLNIEYSRDLFDGKTIERLLEHFETLLRGIVAAPNARLSELPLLTPEERQQIVVDWNRTTTKYPRENCIHELFEAQVQQTPDATAVHFGQQVMTYRELNARANQLAHYLKQFGVGPDAPVGICMRRSVDLIVGLLGILKAGGAYLPLDPT